MNILILHEKAITLSFLTPTVVGGRRSLPPEICTRSNPRSNQAVHVSSHNSGIVRLKKISANRKSTMGFPTSHQPRSWVTPNFPKMGFRYPNLSFFTETSTKNHFKSATKFHSLKASSGKVVAQSTTYRTVSTFWPRSVKFGPKGSDPQ